MERIVFGILDGNQHFHYIHCYATVYIQKIAFGSTLLGTGYTYSKHTNIQPDKLMCACEEKLTKHYEIGQTVEENNTVELYKGFSY